LPSLKSCLCQRRGFLLETWNSKSLTSEVLGRNGKRSRRGDGTEGSGQMRESRVEEEVGGRRRIDAKVRRAGRRIRVVTFLADNFSRKDFHSWRLGIFI
jgi:hypothetical protein